MKICLVTCDIGTAAPEPIAPDGALHPGYYFSDAANEERLGLNTVLIRLGTAMDDEADSGGGAALAPGLAALAGLAAMSLLCFVTSADSPVPAPDLTAPDLLPLDRETVAHALRQAQPFAPPAPGAGMPPEAEALALALATLPEPAAALHWLLLHRLLPALCETATLEALHRSGPALFSHMRDGPALPLEFALTLLMVAPPARPAAERLSLAYWLNVPTAQGVLTALRQRDGGAGQGAARMPLLPRLERADFNRGETGAVVVEHDLHKRTPLWFYLWRERALMGTGGQLGPLGGRLLAEGILGLVAAAQGATGPRAPEETADAPPPEGTLAAWEAFAQGS